MKAMDDVLNSPEIRRHTRAVLALKEKARQAEAGLAFILADLGDELIAAKRVLDRAKDKKVFLRWLSEHVKFTVKSADNYMRIARLRKRLETGFQSFARVPLGALYEIASLPEDLAAKLAKDPRLPSPSTGKLTPLEDMSERDLKKALRAFRGRRGRGSSHRPGPAGTREGLARDAIAQVRALADVLGSVNDGNGKLTSDAKSEVLDAIEDLRKVALHWKAWVTPEKGKRIV
jgi:hypothetical protein